MPGMRRPWTARQGEDGTSMANWESDPNKWYLYFPRGNHGDPDAEPKGFHIGGGAWVFDVYDDGIAIEHDFVAMPRDAMVSCGRAMIQPSHAGVAVADLETLRAHLRGLEVLAMSHGWTFSQDAIDAGARIFGQVDAINEAIAGGEADGAAGDGE